MRSPFVAEHPLYEVKANLFKGVSHPIRVRVLEMLVAAPEVSVTDLLADTGLEASHLSQHLSVLRRDNLVRAARRGNQVYYSITSPRVADLLAAARQLLAEILTATQQQLARAVEASESFPAPLEQQVDG